jgi:hypothetical protein
MRAAAATGFATGKKVALNRAHPDDDVFGFCGISFAYMFGFVKCLFVMSASRIVDAMVFVKRKRVSFLAVLCGTGQETRRLVCDDFVLDIIDAVGFK